MGPLFLSSQMLSLAPPPIDFGTADEPILPYSESVVCRGGLFVCLFIQVSAFHIFLVPSEILCCALPVIPRFSSTEVFDDYMDQYYCKRRWTQMLSHPYPIPIPHPQFFPRTLTDAGLTYEPPPPSAAVFGPTGEVLMGDDSTKESPLREFDVFSVPVLSHTQNSRAITGHLTRISDGLERGNVSRMVMEE